MWSIEPWQVASFMGFTWVPIIFSGNVEISRMCAVWGWLVRGWCLQATGSCYTPTRSPSDFFFQKMGFLSQLASLKFSPIRGGFFFSSLRKLHATTKCNGDEDFPKIPSNHKSWQIPRLDDLRSCFANSSSAYLQHPCSSYEKIRSLSIASSDTWGSDRRSNKLPIHMSITRWNS